MVQNKKKKSKFLKSCDMTNNNNNTTHDHFLITISSMSIATTSMRRFYDFKKVFEGQQRDDSLVQLRQ